MAVRRRGEQKLEFKEMVGPFTMWRIEVILGRGVQPQARDNWGTLCSRDDNAISISWRATRHYEDYTGTG